MIRITIHINEDFPIHSDNGLNSNDTTQIYFLP